MADATGTAAAAAATRSPPSDRCRSLRAALRRSGQRCARDAATSDPRPVGLRRSWQSPDPLLRRLGVRYLQLGGDVWNRCNEGWLNIDAAFGNEGLRRDLQYGTDDKGGHNMMLQFSADARLPFRSNSVQLVYSEHMIEHMLPHEGAVLLREAYRVLAPGGVLRLATPDLALYLCGYVRPDEGFLAQHATRFAPMATSADRAARRVVDLGAPIDATVVNNIFRNYGHRWIYDYDELLRVASAVGIAAGRVCRSDRKALGLPSPLLHAIRRATRPRNASLACWLDQAVREDESLYAHVTKDAPSADVNLTARPSCSPMKEWLPCLRP